MNNELVVIIVGVVVALVYLMALAGASHKPMQWPRKVDNEKEGK